jgi:LmbE family N-acetylglucosaminyl deacetylase
MRRLPKTLKLGCICGLVLWFLARAGARTIPASLLELPPLTAQDRVLICAPHEDDEALGAGGLIQRARSVGASVRVMYLTYGDHNEWAFLAYRKIPILTPKINRQMGMLRRKEATQAMAFLGLPVDHLAFLGYPDNGTLRIWREHWNTARPLWSHLINAREVPYPDAIAYGKPFKGEEILDSIENELRATKPTQIFVTHPMDSNPDHAAYYLFLRVALLDLEGQIPTPQVYTYPIHMGLWPRPEFYNPDLELAFPKILESDPASWWTFALQPDETVRKGEAIRLYKSQMADHGFWLVSFARRNELFGRPDPVLLAPETWSGMRPASTPGDTIAYEEGVSTGLVQGVAYSMTVRGLQIQTHLHLPIEALQELSLYVFGYRTDIPFGKMPKLRISVGPTGARAWDQRTPVKASEIKVEIAGREVTLEIPWTAMGSPRVVFAKVEDNLAGKALSRTSWHELYAPPLSSR